jgi:cytochrome c oxidase cbb3-type subunit III
VNTDTDTSKLEHDGIEKLDQPTPTWWKWGFLATILFSPFYWMFYHFGGEGRSMYDHHSVSLVANTRLQFAEIGELKPDEETILRYMQEPSWLRVGEVVFTSNCASCHGRKAEGKIGPNLTDNHFKNIRKIEDIATIILQGANGNAMPAWADRLHPNEIVLVSAYIANLRGTNADGGKSPDGGEIAAWPAPPKTESKTETAKTQ